MRRAYPENLDRYIMGKIGNMQEGITKNNFVRGHKLLSISKFLVLTFPKMAFASKSISKNFVWKFLVCSRDSEAF